MLLMAFRMRLRMMTNQATVTYAARARASVGMFRQQTIILRPTSTYRCGNNPAPSYYCVFALPNKVGATYGLVLLALRLLIV
jgi:hypothetical protein